MKAPFSLLLPLLLSPLPATAQSGDNQVSGAAVLGLGYQTEDAYRFGRYTGWVEEGVQPWLDLYLVSPASEDDGSYWSLRAEDLGIERSYLTAEWTKPAAMSVGLQYREIPHYYFEDGRSPFLQVGEESWRLPANWQVAGNTTAEMLNIDNFYSPVKIHHERKRLDLNYHQQLPANWSFEGSYRHETKEGSRPVGAMIGSNAGNARSLLLPAALSYRTDIMELAFSHTGARSTLGLSYYGSFFRNAEDSLNWQNSFAAHPLWNPSAAWPSGHGQLAQEPGNSAHRLRLAGSYALTPFTRAHMELGYGQMLQDEDFLPYTTNPSLVAPVALGADSLDGKIETANADLSLSMRPIAKMHVRARYRLDDRDNQTPRLAWQPVTGDAVDQVAPPQALFNRPYSYRKQVASLDAYYRASSRVRVDAGYAVDYIDRDYSEVDESREYTAHLGTRLNGFNDLSLQFAYYYSERRTDDYVGNRPLQYARGVGAVGAEDFVNHPLLRKYYLADRHRDRLQVRADWFVSEALSLGMTVAYNKDDYTDEYFGLNEHSARSYTLDASYRPAEDFLVSAYLGLDRWLQDQSGRSFAAGPGQADDPGRDWWVDAADRFTSVNVTVEQQDLQRRFDWLTRLGLERRLDLGLEFNESRSRADLDTEAADGLPAALPLDELTTRLRYYRFYADYELSDEFTLGISLLHERYESEDFAFDGVTPTTMPRVLGLGEQSPEYSLNWFGLSLGYQF